MDGLKPCPLDEARKVLWYCAQFTDNTHWAKSYRKALTDICDELDRRAAPENKPLTAENEESKGRFAGSGEKSEYIKVPNNLSRELLIKEFGISAVEWYESYLADRISLGKTYLNPQKTIYLWATRDRETGGGWFSRLPRQYDGHKSKGHGGS